MLKLQKYDFPVLKIFLKNLRRQDFRFSFKSDYNQILPGSFSVLRENELENKLELSF
jgi:hypothetical protein